MVVGIDLLDQTVNEEDLSAPILVVAQDLQNIDAKAFGRSGSKLAKRPDGSVNLVPGLLEVFIPFNRTDIGRPCLVKHHFERSVFTAKAVSR